MINDIFKHAFIFQITNPKARIGCKVYLKKTDVLLLFIDSAHSFSEYIPEGTYNSKYTAKN